MYQFIEIFTINTWNDDKGQGSTKCKPYFSCFIHFHFLPLEHVRDKNVHFTSMCFQRLEEVFKVPTRNFSLLTKQSKFNVVATHFIYISKWDHQWGDWRLLSAFYNANAETLWNTLKCTDWKRRFVVYEHDQFAGLWFTIYGCKQESIFL